MAYCFACTRIARRTTDVARGRFRLAYFIYKEGQAVAFFDRTANYYYLVDPSAELPGHSRERNGRFVTLPEAIRFYELHGAFCERESAEQS